MIESPAYRGELLDSDDTLYTSLFEEYSTAVQWMRQQVMLAVDKGLTNCLSEDNGVVKVVTYGVGGPVILIRRLHLAPAACQ